MPGFRSVPWNSQPQVPTGVSLPGCVSAINAASPADLVSGAVLRCSSGAFSYGGNYPSFGRTLAPSLGSNGRLDLLPTTNLDFGTGDFSVVLAARTSDFLNTKALLGRQTGFGGNNWFLGQTSTNWIVGTGVTVLVTGPATTVFGGGASKIYKLVYVRRSGVGQWWWDGGMSGSSAADTANVNASTPWAWFNYGQYGIAAIYTWSGDLAVGAIVNRALADSEAALYSANPNLIFAPQRKVVGYYLPAAASVYGSITRTFQRTSQPQVPTGPDVANPLTKGLAFLFNGATPARTDGRTGSSGPLTLGINAGAGGLGVSTAGSGSMGYALSDKSAFDVSASRLTVVIFASPNANPGAYSFAYCAVGGSRSFYVLFNSTKSLAVSSGAFTLATTGLTTTGATAPGVVDGRPHVFIASSSVTLSSNNKLYVDGVDVTSSAVDGPAALIAGANIDYIGGYSVANFGLITEPIYMAAGFNRGLSDAEIASVSANPWQLFAPIRRRFPIGSATVTVWRPGSDLVVAGWTGTPNATPNLYTNINEVTRDDTNYITSPALTSSSQTANFGWQGGAVVPAGTWTLTFTGLYAGSSGQMRINLIDSGGAVITNGTGSWQATVASYPGGGAEYTTTYTSTSANAAGFQIEVKL